MLAARRTAWTAWTARTTGTAGTAGTATWTTGRTGTGLSCRHGIEAGLDPGHTPRHGELVERLGVAKPLEHLGIQLTGER